MATPPAGRRRHSQRTTSLQVHQPPDIVTLTHLRWDFVFQRPQHLLTRCARLHRVFEELRTVMPAAGTTTDWTHLRIFRVKNLAAVDTFQAGMDAATARVVPDEAQRKANSERSAGLRDAVRREVWTELR